MSVSHSATNSLRGQAAAISSPLWEKILTVKHFILHPFQPSPFKTLSLVEEKEKLKLESLLLENENDNLKKQLEEQRLVISQLQKSESEAEKISANNKEVEKRNKILQMRLNALPARVIFRSFDTWQEALWINVGASTNQDLENPVVAVNSPVISGTAIVGIIDYVGQEQSRVRLITDNRLTPSVRASRGGEQDFLLNENITRLEQQLESVRKLFLSSDEKIQLLSLLKKLKQQVNPLQKTWHLAKGELKGSPYSSRFGNDMTLKGTGFNYDFPDEEGSSRDLRSGHLISDPKEPPIPILNVHDILTTTGMDGVFPPGFQVAVVSKIGLLKEGDYFYELEATPIALPLEELSLVFVLPPISKQGEKPLP